MAQLLSPFDHIASEYPEVIVLAQNDDADLCSIGPILIKTNWAVMVLKETLIRPK